MGIICPLTPPPLKTPKNQNFEKIAADIIILHICTKNHYHMRYGA